MGQWIDNAPADKEELKKLAGLRDGINAVVSAAMKKQAADQEAAARRRDNYTSKHMAEMDAHYRKVQSDADKAWKEARRDTPTTLHPKMGD